MPPNPRVPSPILIDTDPGVDDAVAILLALASGDDLEVRGITTVAGNLPATDTARNAGRILDLANRHDIPVHAGCARPLLRKLETAEHVHGRDGLGDIGLPDGPARVGAEHGVPFLIRTLEAAAMAPHAGGPVDGGITLCTLAPLTNIATALVMAPGIANHIRAIVCMGGGVDIGNVSPVAEFNISVDPHAARIVFESGLPLVMIGLNLTHRVAITEQRLAALAALDQPAGRNPVAGAVARMLDAYGRNDPSAGPDRAAPLHDPCVIAYLLCPALFAGRSLAVSVETESALTMGQTVVDRRVNTRATPNVMVLESVDADGVFALLAERLSGYASA